TTAATGLAGARPPNRDYRQDADADATIGYLTIRRRRGPDLIPDFLDADLADLIQKGNDVAMGRHHFGADRDLDIRVGGVELKKAGQHMILLDKLIGKENCLSRQCTDDD